MSNAVLAAIGMGVTMIAFAAFSVLQLGKADVRTGKADGEADGSPPGS